MRNEVFCEPRGSERHARTASPSALEDMGPSSMRSMSCCRRGPLGELPALRAPEPFSPRTAHTVRVAWAAADIERAGHQWITSREMARAPSRWGAQVANERGGHSGRLPDLAFWPAGDDKLHVAVVVIQGQSNPRRERAALDGWHASISAGRYAQVRYLAGPAAASHLRRVATDIGLTAPQFIAGERVTADELPVLPSIIETVGEGVGGRRDGARGRSRSPATVTGTRCPTAFKLRGARTDARAGG